MHELRQMWFLQIIGSRKEIRKAQLFVIQDLCRKIRDARKHLDANSAKADKAEGAEGGNETIACPGDSEKLQRRIDALWAEVKILKVCLRFLKSVAASLCGLLFLLQRVGHDDVAKLALATDSETLNTPRFLRRDSLGEKCLQTLHLDFERLTSALRRVIGRRCIQDCVATFRREHADWQKIAAFVLYKPSGRRFKKIKSEKQKRQLPLVAFFPIPNADNAPKFRLASLRLHTDEDDAEQQQVQNPEESESESLAASEEKNEPVGESSAKTANSKVSRGKKQIKITDVLSSIFTSAADAKEENERETSDHISTAVAMEADESEDETVKAEQPKAKVNKKAKRQRKRKLNDSERSDSKKSTAVPESHAKVAEQVKLRRGTAVIKTFRLTDLNSDDEVRLDSDDDEEMPEADPGKFCRLTF